MSNARFEAVRRRGELQILELCADEQERLQAAKAAYNDDRTEETRAARQQAMDDMHRLRRWLRENGRPVLPDGGGVLVETSPDGEPLPARPAGRVRRLG